MQRLSGQSAVTHAAVDQCHLPPSKPFSSKKDRAKICRFSAQQICRFQASSGPVLLLVPAWTIQPAYSSLRELSVVHEVRLPIDQFPLLQGYWIHSSPHMFILHAWTLCRQVIEDRDSLHVLLISWLCWFGFQRHRSMIGLGPSTVQSNSLILSISL